MTDLSLFNSADTEHPTPFVLRIDGEAHRVFARDRTHACEVFNVQAAAVDSVELEAIELVEGARYGDGDGYVKLAARLIVEHDLLTDEWQTTRAIGDRLCELRPDTFGWGMARYDARSSALSGLSTLSALGLARTGEEHGPSAFGMGNYVWRRGSTHRNGLPCEKCGGHYEHVWHPSTPASNVHPFTPSRFSPEYVGGPLAPPLARRDGAAV
jgi:hypothetical protein